MAPSPVPDELRRLLGIRARAKAPARVAPDRWLTGDQISPGLRFLEQFHEAPELPDEIDADFARMGRFRTSDLLFFDTETTGLAGGTGTRAFMIGALDVQDDRLRLRQLLTTTMAAETSMLQTFADWIGPQTALVSYNGKSYDRPLLSTRYRLARLPDPLRDRAHIDLLHPVRRRWRGAWENCRLGTVERQLLGVLREDDLPGSEAPRAWTSYLRGGSAANLRRVATHNAQDLRSLAGICFALDRMR
ncbi:ribonuclease H-like domain-containing protein [Arenimonas sp.]|uniref:ribonuclease H-like domain-containing protein n=1 Tax=Arenimonas sp. TaxID=1872635 RepID=UPI0039E38B3E